MSQEDRQRFQQVNQNQPYPEQVYFGQQYQQNPQIMDQQQYQYYHQQQMNAQYQQYGGFPGYQQYPQQYPMYQQYPQQYQQGYRQKPEKRNYDKSTLENPPTIDFLRNNFLPLAVVNQPSFDAEKYQNAYFIILRSSSFDNIHKAMKNGLWTSTSRTNIQLQNIYHQAYEQKKEVILLYSVVRSNAFQGVARLLGPFNHKATFLYWDEPYKWLGSFPLQWLIINELTYKEIDEQFEQQNPQIDRISWRDQVDCSDLSPEAGVFILKCFKQTLQQPENKVLEQFPLLNKREEDIRLQRDNDPQFREQMTYIQMEFEQEPFKQRQKKYQNRNFNQYQYQQQQNMASEQCFYYQQQQQGLQNINQLQQQQMYEYPEQFQNQNIEEKFYVKPQKQKKKSEKKLRYNKNQNIDYQPDPNAVVPFTQQEESYDEDQNQAQE